VRVIHVSAYYAPAWVYGGPPASIHGLCRALRRRGTDVQVVTTDANGESALPATVTGAGAYEGVPVTYCRRTWPRRVIGSRALARTVRSLLPDADVLHIHGLWNRVVWAAAREARRAGVPYVLSPRGMLQVAALDHHAWRKRAAYALLERRTIEGAAVLHATSRREAESLGIWSPASRVVLIPNGINVSEGPAPARPAAPPTMLFVGRIHPIKRLDLLVDAFVRLRATWPDACLVIAGPDEAGLRASLTARAGASAAGMTWTGTVDAAARTALLHRATALVLCSDSESFGLTVLEALAEAVPVVVTRSCGWVELGPEGAGLVVEQSVEALASALGSIAADPEAARVMGLRGRDLARSAYGWDAIAARVEQEYQAVAAGRLAARGPRSA